MDAIKSNGYPENFISNFLKRFWIANIEESIAVPKKPVVLVLL